MYPPSKMGLALLILTLVYVSQIQCAESVQKVSISPRGNDYIVGAFTNSSVLMFSERVNASGITGQIITRNISWSGHGIFRLIEALDQNANGTGGFVNQSIIETHNVQIFIRSFLPGGPIDFIVNVYGEPVRNDYFYGLNIGNPLLYTQRVNISGENNVIAVANLSWTGTHFVRRVVVLDQNTNGNGGLIFVNNITDHLVNISFRAYTYGPGGIDFIVSIYGVPPSNDFVYGTITNNTILAHREHFYRAPILNDTVVTSFNYHGNNDLTRVAALDQNFNGTGARVILDYGGVGNTFTTLFISSDYNGSIDFDINIYVAVERDLTIGELGYQSVLLLTQQVNITGIPNQYRNSSVSYYGSGNHTLAMIQAWDQRVNTNVTALYSPIHLTQGGIRQTSMTLNFTSPAIGQGIYYHVAVYGTTRTGASDFRFGSLLPGNILFYRQRLQVPSVTNDYVVGDVIYNGNRTITLVQGIDQLTNGTGALLTYNVGGVGYTNVTLRFQSSAISRGIDFIVEIYGV